MCDNAAPFLHCLSIVLVGLCDKRRRNCAPSRLFSSRDAPLSPMQTMECYKIHAHVRGAHPIFTCMERGMLSHVYRRLVE